MKNTSAKYPLPLTKKVESRLMLLKLQDFTEKIFTRLLNQPLAERVLKFHHQC